MVTYKVNNFFIVQKIDNKATIFDPESSTLITLNESASLVFRLLKRKKTVHEISKYISDQYNIPLSRATKDTESIIRKMKRKKIIK